MVPQFFRRSWSAGRARFRPLFTLAAWYVLLGLALRVTLWSAFGRLQQVSDASLGWILSAGLVADIVQSLYLLAPFALLLWLLPDKVFRSRPMRATLLTGAFVWMFGLTFVAAAEYFFFAEFDSRLNLVAVDYLMYPTEVVGDIWAEYPVVKVLLATGILTALVVYWRRRELVPSQTEATTLGSRGLVFGALAALVTICALGFETHSLAFSDNRVANEIAANGASSFFRALRTNEIDYHTYYASRPTQTNLRNLVAQMKDGGGKFTRLAEGRVDRSYPANPNGLGKLNVVVVASESFGAEFSKLYGSQRDWTPEFDRIAQQGCGSVTCMRPARARCAGSRPSRLRCRRSRVFRCCAGRAMKASRTGAR
jgi:phosphoglycerol transferase MdoB-like AlkP superfamily enzyme